MACDIPVVLILGPSGTGKTRFTNLAADEERFKEGDSLEPTTTEAQSVMIQLDDKGVVELFDTPDPDGDETEKAKANLQCLASRLKRRNVVGVIYMHNITQNKVNRQIMDSYTWLYDNFLKGMTRNIAIVTTMWDIASGTQASGCYEEREEELRGAGSCYQTALQNGALLLRHHNTRDSALNILRQVAGKALEDCKKPTSRDARHVDRGTQPGGNGGRHRASGLIGSMLRHVPGARQRLHT